MSDLGPRFDALNPEDQARVLAEIQRIKTFYGRIRFWTWVGMMALILGVAWWLRWKG
jgi:hypothetical protein